MLWVYKGCGYGIQGMWLCYKYLKGLVVIGIWGVWLCYWYLRGVVMLWVFKGSGYVMYI